VAGSAIELEVVTIEGPECCLTPLRAHTVLTARYGPSPGTAF
jgi:hypothetical protein